MGIDDSVLIESIAAMFVDLESSSRDKDVRERVVRR